MEKWNTGILGVRAKINHLIVKTPSNPLFRYSIIPLFQLGKDTKFFLA
jgi:hypothetical protein